ncbi:MAG TPA: hypothetical protein PLT06_09880, partial [Syntrophorhabdaceae bacterium]|nr:hypothetical protein [Syntrophorhabdaceae bacterium]
QNTCFLEVIRKEEFSPVKNSEGSDSVETARIDMANLYRGWLESEGFNVPTDIKVEISPLFALDKQEFSAKIKGIDIKLDKDLYLG